MKNVSQTVRIGLSVLALVTGVAAQDAHLFRITGPVPTAITAFGADGYVTWTNVATNATFTIQTATSLKSASNWVDYIRVPATNGVTINRLYDLNPPSGMALIPAGSFTMGNCMGANEGQLSSGNELPLHTVNVSAFYMDRNLVSYTLWTNVYQWATSHGYIFSSDPWGMYSWWAVATNYPVMSMTWYDAVKWCNARSEKEGLVPAYYTDAGQGSVYRSGETNVENGWVKWSSGYRLPTEAEWEKAARGGASGHRFPWSDSDTIDWSRACYGAAPGFGGWFYDVNATSGYNPATGNATAVGTFAPNGYGLYDMAGNVSQWCWDRYDYAYYSSSPGTDPRGPALGSGRVLRGDGEGGFAVSCRVAARSGNSPSYVDINPHIGFRTVLPSGQ